MDLKELQNMSRGINFLIGDYFIKNPRVDDYDSCWDYAQVAEYVKIARMFPDSLRGLSWTSYRLLARIKDEIEREAICKFALKNKLKSKEIKEIINNNKQLKGE